MTREEAIRALRYERKTALHENKSAFDMAIQSLSAEPCEDAISMSVIKDIKAEIKRIACEEATEDLKWAAGLIYSIKIINKHISGKETKKQEPCEDAISRQAVHNLMAKLLSDYLHDEDREKIENTDAQIADLPSVTPKQKVGHWEWVQYDYNPKLGNWHCSECRCIVAECVEAEKRGGIPLYKYCPQCGAKMEDTE